MIFFEYKIDYMKNFAKNFFYCFNLILIWL